MGASCVGREQESISARRGSVCKGMMQHDPPKNLGSLGARKTPQEMQLNSPARLELARLRIQALRQPTGELLFQLRAAGRRAGDLVLPQFPPSAKHTKVWFSKALCGLDELHRKHSVASNFSLCFIGSRVKTFIYFYGTHGLGDFFIIKNKILEKNSKLWFHSFQQYKV